MSLSTLLLIAVALGTDAFALAVGIGVSGIRKKKIVLVSAVVCLFHIFMPLAGLGIGVVLGKLVGDVATVLGAVVLILIGLNMLWSALRHRIQAFSFSQAKKRLSQARRTNYTLDSFWGLMMLAGSVSIDALSVGFSLGALKTRIAGAVLVLGVVAGIMTVMGFWLGRGLGSRLGEKAEIAGGIILVAVGTRLLF